METRIKLTIFFDEPFWIGVFERRIYDKLEVAKVIFDSEPKDYEVYAFVLLNFGKLKFFSTVQESCDVVKKINPKRMQREVRNELRQSGIGTKAQQALKLQHEQVSMERKSFNHLKAEKEKQRKFELKQLKKKEKHRGR